MNYDELFKFAGRCLALGKSPCSCAGIRDRLYRDEALRNRLIQLCSNHLMLPALYLKLRNHGLLDVFPIAYTRQMKEIYDGNRLSNLKILEQMDEISTLLSQSGIEHVYMKGAGNLLGNVYSGAGERMIGDIDFLVRKKDFTIAAELLIGEGYTTHLQGDIICFPPPDHHHFPRLTRAFEAATVEVHRLPVKKKYAKQLTAEMVFAECLSVPGKPNVFVPSDNHKFIQNFIHCQYSNKGLRHRNPTLRWLYDGYLLSEKVNPSEIEAWVKEKNGVRIFYGLLSRTFGLQEAFPADARMKRYIRSYQWFQRHPATHHHWLRINRLLFLIFGAYAATLLKSIYSKPYRRFTWVRLKNPKWYRQHFLLRKKQLLEG